MNTHTLAMTASDWSAIAARGFFVAVVRPTPKRRVEGPNAQLQAAADSLYRKYGTGRIGRGVVKATAEEYGCNHQSLLYRLFIVRQRGRAAA